MDGQSSSPTSGRPGLFPVDREPPSHRLRPRGWFRCPVTGTELGGDTGPSPIFASQQTLDSICKTGWEMMAKELF